jgi:hypothetical protein
VNSRRTQPQKKRERNRGKAEDELGKQENRKEILNLETESPGFLVSKLMSVFSCFPALLIHSLFRFS